MRRNLLGRAACCAVLLLALAVPALAADAAPSAIPVPGMVTLVDLGANRCIPCKLMAPILQEVKAEYQGRAAVIFLDVWENPNHTDRFGIRVIPTQIFYDGEGREAMRHEGFMDKAAIVKVLTRLGVK
jgi:thioredoxin 1